MAIGFGEACPKPLPHKVTKVRKQKVNKKVDEADRNEVRKFYKHHCCVCGRKTNTVHEHKRRGAGGVVSLCNSFLACDAVDGGICHPLLGARQIEPMAGSEPLVLGDNVRTITAFRMTTKIHKLVFSHRAQPSHIEIQD